MSFYEAQEYFIKGDPERMNGSKVLADAFNKMGLMCSASGGPYYYVTRATEALGYHTDYAKARVAKSNKNGSPWWWLRSPGTTGWEAAFVYEDGIIYGPGNPLTKAEGGVRPALWLNLASNPESGGSTNLQFKSLVRTIFHIGSKDLPM